MGPTASKRPASESASTARLAQKSATCSRARGLQGHLAHKRQQTPLGPPCDFWARHITHEEKKLHYKRANIFFCGKPSFTQTKQVKGCEIEILALSSDAPSGPYAHQPSQSHHSIACRRQEYWNPGTLETLDLHCKLWVGFRFPVRGVGCRGAGANGFMGEG